MLASDGPKIDVSVPAARRCRRHRIAVHRRRRLGATEITTRRGIAVTRPIPTVIDLAAVGYGRETVEQAINEAIRLDLLELAELRAALQARRGERGVGILAELLEGFHLTQSHLERLFIHIAAEAGLPRPLTQERVNGFDLDFYWPAVIAGVTTPTLWPD